jgi:hypothetical protein
VNSFSDDNTITTFAVYIRGRDVSLFLYQLLQQSGSLLLSSNLTTKSHHTSKHSQCLPHPPWHPAPSPASKSKTRKMSKRLHSPQPPPPTTSLNSALRPMAAQKPGSTPLVASASSSGAWASRAVSAYCKSTTARTSSQTSRHLRCPGLGLCRTSSNSLAEQLVDPCLIGMEQR